jgi:hypothetical protein
MKLKTNKTLTKKKTKGENEIKRIRNGLEKKYDKL